MWQRKHPQRAERSLALFPTHTASGTPNSPHRSQLGTALLAARRLSVEPAAAFRGDPRKKASDGRNSRRERHLGSGSSRSPCKVPLLSAAARRRSRHGPLGSPSGHCSAAAQTPFEASPARDPNEGRGVQGASRAQRALARERRPLNVAGPP